MSVWADIPSTAKWQAGPRQWGGNYTALTGEITAEWLVPWEDWEDFKKVCLYTPQTITVPGGSITRNVPLQCKWDPALSAVAVQPVSVSASTADPDDEPDADHTWILARVTFGQPTYPTEGPTPYVEIQTDGEIQDATVPNWPYEFLGASPAELIAQDVAVPFNVKQKNIVWHQLDNPDAAEVILDPLEGKVNSVALTIGAITYPIDTVHFQHYSIHQTFLTGNNKNATLTIRLAIRKVPTWQQAMRANGAFGTVVKKGTSTPPLERADLSPIIRGY